MTVLQMVADLVACDSSEYRFSDWETDFIESVAKQSETRDLSAKQQEIVSRIWDDAFIRGKRSAPR